MSANRKIVWLKGDYVGNHERQAQAQSEGCKLVIEFHFNSNGPTATGGETWFKPGDPLSIAVATDIRNRYSNIGLSLHGPGPNAADSSTRAGWLPFYSCSAILLEPLYVSNPGQARWIHQSGNIDLLTEQVTAAILNNTSEADVIGLSIGHRFKHSHPNDMGAPCALGDSEAKHGTALAEAVAAKLTSVAEAAAAVAIVPAPENPVLTSPLFQGNAVLEAVAEGHLVLQASGTKVDGIGPVQDALNTLGFPINLGSTNQFRGFFGEKTQAAVEPFQTSANIDVDGRVGSDTIKKLDESLVASAAGGEAPAAGAPVPAGKFAKTRVKVLNRGIPSPEFLQELVAWGKMAPEEIFVDQPGNKTDVYASVITELGPFADITHRKACMLEVMRVLAGFESSWKWNEGIDTSRTSEDTPENSEGGAWQVSADSLRFGEDLKDLVKRELGTLNGVEFQKAMKAEHPLAMEYIARLMRHTRMHNGPLYKGEERSKFKPKLRGEEQSVYPWLSRDAVAEFQAFLA
jgi:peptidoglycan hydrolase-like protein with peptidoglycan-binding domain